MVLEFDNTIPIYIQLVEYFKMEIISGNLEPGKRLASVRDLAIQYKVNPNTLQKALIELENMGLIYTERTNGKYVTTNEELINKIKMEYAFRISNDYFSNMKNLGYNKNDTINYLKQLGGNK